eukprot:jgi/Chrzof1/4843/Cz15g01090.t1
MSPGRALLLPTWQKVAQCTHTSLAPATPVIRFQRALHSDNATRHKHSFNHPAATSAAASAAVAVAPPSQAVADRHAPSGEALLLVQPRHRSSADQQEAQRLVETFTGHSQVPYLCLGSSKCHTPAAATYFTSGNVNTIAAWCNAHGDDIHRVFVNAKLSGVQERNLERALGKPVIDRVGLIIGIFSQRAKTKEAQIQVQLAQLRHELSRLVRETTSHGRGGFGAGGSREVVSERQRGHSGSGYISGSGESELRVIRARILHQRRLLEDQLQHVKRTRQVQRAGRKKSGLLVVALVGYTNAGKSSLLGVLSGADVATDDQLFATLDPLTRRVLLPSGRPCLVSDTVGFISDLPVSLIQAFRSTLEEVLHADLLLHVIDASSPHAMHHRETVMSVLRDIGVPDGVLDSRLIEVWNKADLLLPIHEEASKDDLLLPNHEEASKDDLLLPGHEEASKEDGGKGLVSYDKETLKGCNDEMHGGQSKGVKHDDGHGIGIDSLGLSTDGDNWEAAQLSSESGRGHVRSAWSASCCTMSCVTV